MLLPVICVSYWYILLEGSSVRLPGVRFLSGFIDICCEVSLWYE